MACSGMPVVLVTLGVYLLLQPSALARAAPGDPAATPARRHMLSPFLRARLEPYSGDILIDDADDQLDLAKRQFDDYGHMRFGKRGEPEEKFDDYGHMRFGRAHV